jgi:hypothetical protein
MFFDLLALQAALESFRTSGRWRSLCQLAAGLLLATAFFSKQNYGLFFAPVVLAVLAAGELPRLRRACLSLALMGAGTAIGAGVALAWAWIFSDPAAFVDRVFRVAGEIGRGRLTGWSLMSALSLGSAPQFIEVEALAVLMGAIALAVAAVNYRRPVWREMAPAAVCALALPFYHHLTQTFAFQYWDNDMAFAFLATCAGLGLFERLYRSISLSRVGSAAAAPRLPSGPAVRAAFRIVGGLWLALSVAFIAASAWARHVNDNGWHTTFQHRIRAEGLDGLRWGTHTMLGLDTTLEPEDFERTVDYLKNRGGSFYVMGVSGVLYGLLRVPPPQPLLYYQPRHSFLLSEASHIDEAILSSLERNDVRTVVRESITWAGPGFPYFPRTSAWVESRFRKTAQFGIYEIRERIAP